MNKYISMFFLQLFILSDTNANSTSKLSYDGFDGIKIGSKILDVTTIKSDIIIQNYGEGNDIAECVKAKNIIIDNFSTSLDFNNNGILTAIYTTGLNVATIDGIKIGSTERDILNIKAIKKEKKMVPGEDTKIYYTYTTPVSKYNTYFVFNSNEEKVVDFIVLYSVKHVDCAES